MVLPPPDARPHRGRPLGNRHRLCFTHCCTPLTIQVVAFDIERHLRIEPLVKLFHLGVARTFQVAHEFSNMPVIENLMLVPAGQSGESLLSACLAWGRVREEEAKLRKRAEEVVDFLRLGAVRYERAGNLSGGQKKLLELGRVMMADPKVVLLDEVGAGVNRTLLAELASDIERLNRDRGYTFFVIEHDMDLIARLCDPVIVMAAGRVLTQGRMADIRKDDRVVEAYFGGGARSEAA